MDPERSSSQSYCLFRLTPNQAVPLERLRDLGVLYWKLDADNHKTDPKLAAIRKVRGYSYQVYPSDPARAQFDLDLDWLIILYCAVGKSTQLINCLVKARQDGISELLRHVTILLCRM